MVGQITGESIKSAISLKIKSSFAKTSGAPPTTVYPTIYKEQIVQGFEKPSFFIWPLDTSGRRESHRVYWIDHQIQVRYHPTDEDLRKYETLDAVGISLIEYLSEIEVPISKDGLTEIKLPVIGKQMSYKITDGVLQFYVTYSIKASLYQIAGTKMTSVDINEAI